MLPVKKNREKVSSMSVITRSGIKEKVSFDKILTRLEDLADELDVDPFEIAKETIKGLHNDITTTELDTLSADISASRTHHHPDYNIFAARIAISNLHKLTSPDFAKITSKQFLAGRVSAEYHDFVIKHAAKLQEMIQFNKDYYFDYFGFKTLERSYLNRVDGKIVERPQYYILRVAIQIHIKNPGKDLENIRETYLLMSDGLFTHASPTLFNSGSDHPQLSSCFLLNCEDDLNKIFDLLKNIGMISKWAGGIGVSLCGVRAKGTMIKSTGGASNGIIKLCRALESIGQYVDQGGRRKGSIAIFLEPWHADIFEFLDLRKATGDEKSRARDIFTGLWVNDLFMKRVREGGMWSLMCPHKCPHLTELYGEEFEKLYLTYENAGQYVKQIPAMDLWNAILVAQIETGTPYFCFKDSANGKSNQKNLGVIHSSNLCVEVMEVTDGNNIAVCNLASICLPKFLSQDGTYNFELLRRVTRIITRNLNNIIDCNYYPVKETRQSNVNYRPIGIGVQGLVDVFHMLNLPYNSDKASKLNKEIFEHIYFAAIQETVNLAKENGRTYVGYQGSPFSQGQVQWHLWGLTQDDLTLDWTELLADLKTYGTYNSLLTALMPTATTSQILGNTESMEVPSSNIYVRQTLAGEYIVANQNLVRLLIQRNLWTDDIYHQMIYDNGSIQNIPEIPEEIKEIYKTAFEVKQSDIIQQSLDRAPFIDQSQSLNLNFSMPDPVKLSSAHFKAWNNGYGLKTGMYYHRTRPAADPIKFGLDATIIAKIKSKRAGVPLAEIPLTEVKIIPTTIPVPTEQLSLDQQVQMCSRNALENGGACDMCSS